jgi:GMP synthase-like glutamine amidotransferase
MKLIVLQHLAVEHPGVFRDFFREDGFEWTAVELDEGEMIPDLEPFDAMVVMGGPQDVWQEDQYSWLVPEKAAIRRFVADMRRPYLGICLGHQLLADALGGRVGPGVPEVGALSIALTDEGRRDPLLAGVADSIPVLQWHGAAVTELPDGAVSLARSDVCAVQALRWGKHAYGMQFHLEATEETVSDWAAIPEYARALEKTLGAGAVNQLAADVEAQLPTYTAVARQIYENFKALA